MSIRVTTLVWDRFPGSGSELLMMQALSDWCSDDGESLYPSIAYLAAKMRVSESQTRRVLHSLIEQGYVVVIGNPAGGAPGMTREYRLDVDKLNDLPLIPQIAEHRDRNEARRRQRATGRMSARGSAHARGSMDARDGSHGCKGTGSAHATQDVRETLVKRESGCASRLSQDWKVPEAWKTWAVAARPEFTSEFVDEIGERFRKHWDGAAKTNWKAVWEKWITEERARSSLASGASGVVAAGSMAGNWWEGGESAIAVQGAAVGARAKRIDEPLPHYLVVVAKKSGKGPWVEFVVRNARRYGPEFYNQVVDALDELLPADFYA
ncbi:hypothetical protein PQR52_01600 [Paraburkholderia aspalathi]|uniref:helix-turn-helix domain-containing protein n=1 Tax=Paraburkholderia aspalathi TaxID=1324617 RepID=UPI0038BDCCF4